jgi:hypothetical protein
MPTYKNLSSTPEVINNVSFLPLEEKQVDFYIRGDLTSKFKKISEEPFCSPVVYSRELTGGEFSLSANYDQIKDANSLRIVCSNENHAKISFNNSTYPIVITATDDLIIKPLSVIDKIKVIEGKVNIEFWRPVNWRS